MTSKVGSRVIGIEEAIAMVRSCPLYDRKGQIRLLYRAARGARKDIQSRMKREAPRGRGRAQARHAQSHAKAFRTRKRKDGSSYRTRRKKGRLRSVRVWIPRGGDYDYPEVRIVGPRHMTPTNTAGHRYGGWLRIDDAGDEIAKKAVEQLEGWAREYGSRVAKKAAKVLR